MGCLCLVSVGVLCLVVGGCMMLRVVTCCFIWGLLLFCFGLFEVDWVGLGCF